MNAQAACEYEQHTRDNLQHQLNQAKATAGVLSIVGAILTAPVGGVGGLIGAAPAAAAAFIDADLKRADAALSECYGAIARREIVNANRHAGNASLIEDYSSKINAIFLNRKNSAEEQFQRDIAELPRRASREGYDLRDSGVQARLQAIVTQLRAIRDQQIQELERQRLQELGKPIESVNPGFYRAHNAPEVFWVCDDSYCHIPNPDVMQCFGWENVNLIDQSHLNRLYVNRTDGPQKRFVGYIRQKDRCEVYKLYDSDKYCGVTDPAQMNRFGGFGQIRVINYTPNVLVGLTYTGNCPG